MITVACDRGRHAGFEVNGIDYGCGGKVRGGNGAPEPCSCPCHDEPAERFLLRTVGGPAEGTRVVPGPWPLPDELQAAQFGGVYRKRSESDLPPQADDSHVMRGAEYEWCPEG